MKIYNVWICVEKIDEEKDEKGTDIVVEKVAKFKKEKEAVDFALELARNNDTLRDKDNFTI